MLFWFELISADMTKVLVCAINSRTLRTSYLVKLYGDPEQYVYKLANDTFADKLPIQMNWLWIKLYRFFSFISLDQDRQRVWYGNNAKRQVQFGNFIYKNSTPVAYSYRYPPETNQVLQHH